MGTRDPRVDAYIAKSAEFAPPILARLREVVHGACPEVEETLKWGMPTFMYRGIMCSMAAFKKHAVFGFWKGALILDAAGNRADEAMGQFGRIGRLSELPSKRILTGYVRKAMELNEQGIKSPTRGRKEPRKPLPVPVDLKTALAKNRVARLTFERFSPSARREYVEWIVDAKRDETRRRRVKSAVASLAAGKPHNWQYTKKVR